VELDGEDVQILAGKLRRIPLQITKRIAAPELMIILFLFWNWGFLQGIFWDAGLKLKRILVLRAEKEIMSMLGPLFQIYPEMTKCLKLSEKSVKFSKEIQGINDDILLLWGDGIGNSNEQRAKVNLENVLNSFDECGEINTVQKFLPVMLIEEMIPQVGLSGREYLLVDLKRADFCPGLVRRAPENVCKNTEYVENVTQFVEKNYEVVRNHIEREKVALSSEELEHIYVLKVAASVISYVICQSNFGEEYKELKKGFHTVISYYQNQWECNIDSGDLIEVFRLHLCRALEREGITICSRKNLPDFDKMEDFRCVFVDKKYFYFRQQFLKECCKGELSSIPFVRILRELKEEEYLKCGKRETKDLTTVVNLICANTEEVKLARFVGIKKCFFNDSEDDND